MDLYPAQHSIPAHAVEYGVLVRLNEFVLRRPRQWGACWVACRMWDQLKLEEFWAPRLPVQLTHVAAAFKDLKDDLCLRPLFHQLEHRIEAHILVAFLAYCLHVNLRQQLRRLAPGLTPRSVLEKFAAMQMLDVHFPTTDGRELIFRRYTQPEKDQKMLLAQLGWELPPQQPPRITAKGQLMED